MSKTPIQLAVQMALYDERNAIVEWLTSKRDSFRAAAHSKRELGVAPEWVAINSHIADAYQTAIGYVNGRREPNE